MSSKSIIITQKEWETVQQEIRKHYPVSVCSIRSKMRKVLGFTPRDANSWASDYSTMSLDFFDDAKKTMFLLRFGHLINPKKNTLLVLMQSAFLKKFVVAEQNATAQTQSNYKGEERNMTIDRKLFEFCQKYDAWMGNSPRAYRRIEKMDFNRFAGDIDGLVHNYTNTYKDVKCVEIHMPEDRFRALLEFDDWVSKAGLPHSSQVDSYSIYKVIGMIKEYEKQCRIRNENPAVQKAWEQYQMLYKMVEPDYS
jgi:hypothetical protein